MFSFADTELIIKLVLKNKNKQKFMPLFPAVLHILDTILVHCILHILGTILVHCLI